MKFKNILKILVFKDLEIENLIDPYRYEIYFLLEEETKL